MPRYNKDDESDDTTRRPDEYWQIKYKIRAIDQWRAEQDKSRSELEKRIRVLEDYKLKTVSVHKSMITWITIASTAFAAVVSLLEHIIFK